MEKFLEEFSQSCLKNPVLTQRMVGMSCERRALVINAVGQLLFDCPDRSVGGCVARALQCLSICTGDFNKKKDSKTDKVD